MSHKKRQATLGAIIKSSHLYNKIPKLKNVEHEVCEIYQCKRTMPPRRGRLLQALHATRALDTCLGEFLIYYGESPEHSLGPRFKQLKNIPLSHRSGLSNNLIDVLQRKICNKRNDYVHNANKYPNSNLEVDSLVSDVSVCLISLL